MKNFPISTATIYHVLSPALCVLGLAISHGVLAQSFQTGDFENGDVGWSGCLVEIGAASAYGGVGNSMVAAVNGNILPDASDDHLLCQSISGFVVGNMYRSEFDATRSGIGTPPDTVSASIFIDNDALYRTVRRSGEYAMRGEAYDFTASLTTHEFSMETEIEGPHGMLFDNFTITPISILPIELLYFTGEAVSNGVRLEWATATELDNDYFTVQRSQDGKEWYDVLVRQGAGTSVGQIEYSALDASPLPGLAYYRLKQTDIDGSETIFNSLAIRTTGGAELDLAVFPDPSNGSFRLIAEGVVEEEEVPVTILDMQGRAVHTASITLEEGVATDITEDMPLSKGVYLLSLPIAGVRHGVRVVVQ